MPSVIQPAEFFVVGGPVQPERRCYVERAADRRLAEGLRAKRLCCVLGPAAIGKSSLLLRAAQSLRASGTLVATVDLRRIVEEQSETAERPLCLIAARIAAELGLEVDVGEWWGARDAVHENRLVEFFWKIVLTNTTAPVAILVDDVDAALESSFAGEFLDSVASCYARRSRERDFGRLAFAFAGRTPRRELEQVCPEPEVVKAELIEPEDFTAEESYRLAVAFGGNAELAHALMDRICSWTGGQPYLTQRVARGVARKGGRFEDVERVVREQLLTLEAAGRDPLLAHVRGWLTEPSRPSRRAVKLLRKLAAGGSVAEPVDAEIAERLWLSGTVRVDSQRRLGIRNRIVKELVAAGWLKTNSRAPKWAAAAAALLVAAAAGGYWYTQRLPVADIETLTSSDAAPDAVEESYRRLRGLPGFEQRADELWLAALDRQSRASTTLAAAMAADMRLRELPGQDENADRLLSEFWLRRARERAHAEQRDAAILLAQRGAALRGAHPAAVAYLAELVGDDYARLERSVRLASTPEHWHAMFARATVVSIDTQRRAHRTPFRSAAGEPATAGTIELTALQHFALTRELSAEGEGTAGELELTLAVQHGDAAELLVTLTAPSGATATVDAASGEASTAQPFSFDAAPGSALAQLADEGVRGVWRLTIVDRESGNTGALAGWGVRFGDITVRDDPAELVPIPDPVRVADVEVRAAAERAVAWPATAGAVGTLAVWNLATGELEHDFTLPAPPREVALDATGARVLAATDRLLTVWDVTDGAPLGRVGTETEFVLPPVFSPDGGYVAIAERVDGSNPLYSVLRSADGSLVATIEGAADVQRWELGPGGRYAALQGPESVLRVIEMRRGAELRRLPHPHAVERLLHSSDGAVLVTVDGAGAIASWPLALASAGLGRPLGRTISAETVSASADGRRLAFTRGDGAVAVVDVPTGTELYRLRIDRSVPVTRTQLSADGGELVTQSGVTLKVWRLPARPVTPRSVTADALPTALALDRAGDLIAVGLASGQLQIAAASAPAARPSLSFFGHRGSIAAAAVNGSHGLVATGGSDGVVRVWDVASSSPTPAIPPPADAPVTIVTLSADGQYVASAAARTVRTAAVADGRATGELQVEGAVTAVAFAPDAARLAVGDAGGAVVIAPLELDARDRRAVPLDAAVTALAFAPDGRRLAVATVDGAIALLAAADGNLEGRVRHWSAPIRWLEFSPDGAVLLVATDAWVHALAATPTLTPLQSKLVVWPASELALNAVSATTVGFAGVDAGGALVSGVTDVSASSSAVPADASALVARDWSTLLEMRLNDNGEPVPLDP